jgi:hypothetical protein
MAAMTRLLSTSPTHVTCPHNPEATVTDTPTASQSEDSSHLLSGWSQPAGARGACSALCKE